MDHNDDGHDDGHDEINDDLAFNAAEEGYEKYKQTTLHLAQKKAIEADEVRRIEKDLIKRAHTLMGLGEFEFPNVRTVKVPGADYTVTKPVNNDTNRLEFMRGLFGEGDQRPHINTFTSRAVDEDGRIIDDHYPVVDLVIAANEINLEDQSCAAMRSLLKEWARKVSYNDLARSIERNMPEWDGTPRIRTKLIEMFRSLPDSTGMNEDFGEYFWLSLYCRVMHPGGDCNAPMALAMIGAQNSGKSYFGQRICQILMQDQNADTVQLDLASLRDQNGQTKFVRSITGASIIAAVGEMTGFNRADLNEIKNFMSRKSDAMDWKYEGNFTQMRHWIVMMDGNKYEGLQRDETGNRRFYPMFVGQLPDENGQPQWQEGFQINFDGFESELWQIMSECRAWLAAHNGMTGYLSLVNDVSRRVSDFSRYEMQKARGVIKDDVLETHILTALQYCAKSIKLGRASANKTTVRGWYIAILRSDIELYFNNVLRLHNRVVWKHLTNKMTSLGAEYREKCTEGRAGYAFDAAKYYHSLNYFEEWIGREDEEGFKDDSLIVQYLNANGRPIELFKKMRWPKNSQNSNDSDGNYNASQDGESGETM